MELEEEQLARKTFPMLPTRLALAAWKAGYHDLGRLSRATDDELMDAAGIDITGLAHIRAALLAHQRPSE